MVGRGQNNFPQYVLLTNAS